jgi:C-terminal processing protease CtpA/Prc
VNRVESRSSSISCWWFGLLGLALLACAAVAAVGWLREAQSRHDLRLRDQEVARLQEAARKAERQLQQLQVGQDELERYRKQAEEVHRLRGQYQEWQRLKEEHAALKTENDRLRAALSASPGAAAAVATGARGSWIGISLAPGPAGSGVAVLTLAPGGPAANSGLQAGDVILAVEATPVNTFQQVKELIRAKPPGQPLVLDLSRQGTRFQVSVLTAPMPSFE